MLAPLIELYDSLSPIIIVIVSIGWWRSASRNRVGEGKADLPRSHIEERTCSIHRENRLSSCAS